MPNNQGQEFGQYNSIRYTPFPLAKLIVDNMPDIGQCTSIIDVGAGSTGVWGKAATSRFGIHTSKLKLVGVEIRPVTCDFFSVWFHRNFFTMTGQDFLSYIHQTSPTIWENILWVCNPPFDMAEQFLYKMASLSMAMREVTTWTTKFHILMFHSAGALEGKRRRKELYEIFPPNNIIHLDGRLSDRAHSQQKGQDKRGRLAMYWDLQNKVRNGDTRLKWVGSDNYEDYLVERRDEPGYESVEGENNAEK